MAPSRSASSSEEDTSSNSSDHDEVEQQPPRLVEQQNAAADDSDSNEESDEETGGNGASPKLSLPASNEVVPDSESEDDEVPPKTNRKAPSPSAPRFSYEQDDDSSGSGDEEDSGDKDGAPPPQGSRKVRYSESNSDSEDDENYQVPDTESNRDEAPTPLPKETLLAAADHVEKPQCKRKSMSTSQSPQLKRMRPADLPAEHALSRSDVDSSDMDKLFKDKCDTYSLLGKEVLALEAKYPGMTKVPFLKMDANKAKDLNAKLHEQQIAQMRADLRRANIQKELTNVLISLLK